MKRIFAFAAVVLFAFLTTSFAQSNSSTRTEQIKEYSEGVWDAVIINTQYPKNVIFIVGDGMGTAQVYASIIAQGEKSQFLRFPFSGFSRTYSNNKYTTDSGAGGSALMTGHKVNNYTIAQSSEGTPYSTFYDYARKEKGKSTGFVCSCSMVDATPASTYGHVPDRHMNEELSLQMSQCGHSVMIGADQKVFLPEGRKDGTSPIDTLKQRGYSVVSTMKELKKIHSGKVCAMLSENDAPGDAKQRKYWLVDGTKKAIELLDQNPNGFCLMVEGSQIDWACHNNDTPYLQTELDEFEQMLKVVLDFAEKDGNTLVVVTADHETGGLALTNGDIKKGESECKFTTGSHSGVMVPVFSYGLGAHEFSGIQQNTDFYNKIVNLIK